MLWRAVPLGSRLHASQTATRVLAKGHSTNLLGHCVMVAQRALNSLALVRFQVSLPRIKWKARATK